MYENYYLFNVKVQIITGVANNFFRMRSWHKTRSISDVHLTRRFW